MKFFFLLVIIAALGMVSAASAINLGIGDAKEAAGKAGYSQSTSETTFAETLGTVVKAALSFVGVIFLSLMVYAGFLWLNSRGEESQIDKAKEIIKAAIIGLVITAGAYSITSFVVPRVLERTAGPGGGDPTVGTETAYCCEVFTVSGSARVRTLKTVDGESACIASCEGEQVCTYLGAMSADLCR